jgi:hypothetical protein
MRITVEEVDCTIKLFDFKTGKQAYQGEVLVMNYIQHPSCCSDGPIINGQGCQ